MSKWAGFVGYDVPSEEAPDAYFPQITEHPYVGDVLSLSARFSDAREVNNTITLSKKVSIIGDPFAFDNFMHIRYVTYLGQKWKVTNVDVQYPRLELTIGEVYK